ncbi:MAG: hypothetical protein C0501_14550 [Isosphaera sp.]|nr:hypothetical protein [Isosphaera sp.]
MTTRERAAEALGLPPGATAAEAAAAFLAGLPAAGFVPAPARVAAVNALAGATVPADPDEDDGAAAEVEAFAREFWSVAPAARRTAWDALRAGVGDGPVSARLLDLQPGLDVDPDPVPPGPAAEEVAALVKELFVLPPRERAVRRNGWLLANAGRHADLVAGTKELAHLRPDLVGLDPVLAARLSPAFDAAAFAAAAEALPLMEPVTPEWPEPSAWSPAGGGSQPSRAKTEGAGFGLPVYWLLIVGFGVIVKLCGGGLSDRSSPSRAPLPPPEYRPYSPQPLIPQTTPRTSPLFHKAQVELFREYADNPQGPAPPSYQLWLEKGRPDGATGLVPNAPVHWERIFGPKVIEECRLYERAGGAKPGLYDAWVKYGRPGEVAAFVGPKANP